uniref:Uncharacterized protein n=1 Tax=viral metagenome TaxID=1070528 RepID=A0A2V0RAF9_9ZZZZ
MAPFEDGFDISTIAGTVVGAGAVVGITTFAIATVGRAGSAVGGGSVFPASVSKLEKAWVFWSSGRLFSQLTAEEQSKYRTDFATLYRTPSGAMKKGATSRLRRGGF